MRFQEFSKFTIRPHLFENKQQYKQIVDTMVNGKIIDQGTADSVVTPAKQLLKRADRIIWWLRWWRISTTRQVISDMIETFDNDEPGSSERIARLEQIFKKVTKRDINDPNLKYDVRTFDQHFGLDDLSQHWGAMFEQSPQVNAIEWKADMYPAELITELKIAESEWGKKQSQEIEPKPDDQIVIDYGKYAWVKLDREYCEAEGRAMEHCGNTGTPQAGDRILSFRTKIGDKKQKPHLTFILDKDGFLGEMKGRRNQKPSEKYHPYIIDLLQKDFVKGIKSGGYMAQNNFSLRDLKTEEQREQLIKQKPGLGSSYDLLKYQGRPSMPFYKKLETELDSHAEKYVTVDENENVVVFDAGRDIDQLSQSLAELSSNSLVNLYRAVDSKFDNGRRLPTNFLEIDDLAVREYIEQGIVEELFEMLDRKTLLALEKYIKENYDEYDKDTEIRSDDILEIVVKNDELYEVFSNAVGYGMVSSIVEGFVEAFDDWFENNDNIVIDKDDTSGVRDTRPRFLIVADAPAVSKLIDELLSTGVPEDVYDPDMQILDNFIVGEKLLNFTEFDVSEYEIGGGIDMDDASKILEQELSRIMKEVFPY